MTHSHSYLLIFYIFPIISVLRMASMMKLTPPWQEYTANCIAICSKDCSY
jgi:hypothetical protein